MINKIVIAILIVSLFSCKFEKKPKVQTFSEIVVPIEKDTYSETRKKTVNWINHHKLDLAYIRKKKLGEKKFLAEFLGLHWKLYKSTHDKAIKKALKLRVEPYYNSIQESAYHNMESLDDKLFKKNSMSYLRVMWLFKEMDFDISHYQKEFNKVKKRMSTHLKTRGNWQKEVFKEYYEYFKFEMPQILKNTKTNNGIIDTQLPFERYNKSKAYNFTHFVFAGFEYGNKTTQTRFDQKDILYIKNILPKFTKYYRETKPNIDLLGEFVTCMVYMGFTQTEEFKKSYQYILDNQNENGTWGHYERYRKKIGSDVVFRVYQHTTLVNLEAILEYNEGDFLGSLKK